MMLIVAVVVMFVIAVLVFTFSGEFSFSFCAAFLVAFIFVLLPSMIASFFFDTEPLEPYVSSSIEISAMKDGSKTEGSMFLGSGMIESTPHYIYIEDTPHGKRMDSVAATESTYVIEDNTETPRIDFVKQGREYVSEKAQWWFGPPRTGETTKVKIYVPEDSVVTDYEVDLE